MVECKLNAWRGGFHLEAECSFRSDWTVVFGPSGSGKSTLLRLLAGLDRPHAGSIVLDGQTITNTGRGIHFNPGRRRIGMVAQQPALFPHLTVAANVAYGLRGLDRATRDARVQAMLALVDAADLADRRTRNLSGGEAQRVALARALAPLPRLLLLDEPFSALDGAASDALLLRLLGWAAEHGMQTVLVTHDATDAFTTNAEVAILRGGRVTEAGPAAVTLAAERARIVARLGGA